MIEVKDVYFKYRNDVEALKGIRLTVKEGERYSISFDPKKKKPDVKREQ